MTIVRGQIESLKRLKAELNQKGIKRFNSIGDINDFLKNYEFERQGILSQTEHDLNREIQTLYADRAQFQENYDQQKTSEILKLNQKIVRLRRKVELIKTKNGNTWIKAFRFLQLFILKSRKTQLEKKFNKIIQKKTLKANQKVQKTNIKKKTYHPLFCI